MSAWFIELYQNTYLAPIRTYKVEKTDSVVIMHKRAAYTLETCLLITHLFLSTNKFSFRLVHSYVRHRNAKLHVSHKWHRYKLWPACATPCVTTSRMWLITQNPLKLKLAPEQLWVCVRNSTRVMNCSCVSRDQAAWVSVYSLRNLA